MVLDDLDVVEGGTLLLLGDDLGDQRLEVRLVLLGLGPLGLGKDLLLERELGGTAHAVDTVVRLLFVEAFEGLEDGLVLLGD